MSTSPQPAAASAPPMTMEQILSDAFRALHDPNIDSPSRAIAAMTIMQSCLMGTVPLAGEDFLQVVEANIAAMQRLVDVRRSVKRKVH